MIKPEPLPLPGAPPYVIWGLGVIFIVLAIALVVSVIAIATWLYRDARDRGQPGWLWAVLGLIGGWLTALAWMLIRDRVTDPGLTRVTELLAEKPPRPGVEPDKH